MAEISNNKTNITTKNNTQTNHRLAAWTTHPLRALASYVIIGLLAGILGAAFYGYFVKNDTSSVGTGAKTFTTVNEQSAIIDVAKKVSPSVVSITSTSSAGVDFFGQSQTQEGAGTGMIVTSDGLILTNKHVISGATDLAVITNDGKKYDNAKVVATDPSNDIALVKIDAHGLPTVSLGDSGSVQVGQSVIAIGNALGQFQNSVTTGIISGQRQSITAGTGSESEELSNLLQTDAAINPGNSGGPLVNIDGQVIGMNTAVAGQGAQNIGFAIPINDAKSDISSYQSGGKIVRPFLGVRYVTITSDFASQNNLPVQNGAYVSGGNGQPGVVAGSPADKAGLQEGDIITKVNNQTLDDKHPLAAVISGYKVGDKVTVTYLRGGKSHTADITLGQNNS